MISKVKYIIFLLIFFINSCATQTPAVLADTYFADYVSAESVFQEDSLYVRVNADGLLIWFQKRTDSLTPPTGDDIDKVTLENITGVDPVYTFQTDKFSGNIKFSDTFIEISYLKKVAPYFNFRNIKCDKIRN